MRTKTSQGLCDTTQTERFVPIECKCDTYATNLGPCALYDEGREEHCIYCDHRVECHQLVDAHT